MTDAPAKEVPPLLSHAAHEIRNSLSSALGYIGFVLRDKKTKVADSHREWLEVANKSCGRLTDLANELSELSVLESGKPPLNRVPTDLRALLADAIAALPVLADREIAVELSTGDGPAIIKVDSARLKKAFTAVVSALRTQNALSPKLFVEERAGYDAGRSVSWILIADNMEQLAELRHTSPASLGRFNPSIGNTGMSLWIAREVLIAHGGAIWGNAGTSAAVLMVPHV